MHSYPNGDASARVCANEYKEVQIMVFASSSAKCGASNNLQQISSSQKHRQSPLQPKKGTTVRTGLQG